MALITRPAGVTFQEAGRWRLDTTTPTTGRALNGRSQTFYAENRVWMNTYQVVGAWFDENEGEYMAFLDDLYGPANRFALPIYNRTPSSLDLAALWEAAGVSDADIARGYIEYSDGTHFDDGTGFSLPDGADPVVAADALAGATTITLQGLVAELLWVGAGFSVDGFYYRVAENNGGVVRFNPPLRAAISAGTVAKVSVPEIHVKLMDDDAARAAHEFSQIGGPYYLSVMESFDR